MTILKITIYRKDNIFVYVNTKTHRFNEDWSDFFINGKYRGRKAPTLDMEKFINIFIKE